VDFAARQEIFLQLKNRLLRLRGGRTATWMLSPLGLKIGVNFMKFVAARRFNNFNFCAYFKAENKAKKNAGGSP